MHDKAYDIVKTARSWVGVKWRHQGRTRQGVDCVGLVIKVAHELNISTYDTNIYGRRPIPEVIIQRFKESGCIAIPTIKADIGDVVMLQTDGLTCHCAFLGKKNEEYTLIHAYAPQRKVIEETMTNIWSRSRTGAWRLP